MDLAMINAIEQFDDDNNKHVDKRVGVHSGSVNCGIVGRRKLKFDIFQMMLHLQIKWNQLKKRASLFTFI